MFEKVQQTGWRTIALFYSVDIVMTFVLVFGLFSSDFLRHLEVASKGLINLTLIANLLNIAIVVCLIILLFGRLRVQDIGLNKKDVLPGLWLTLIVWGLIQAIELLAGLLIHGDVQMNPFWGMRGFTVIVGALVAQLFGNALFEEIGYRGFLLQQLYLKFGGRWSDRPRVRLLLAILITNILFALMHIPVRLYQKASLLELPGLLLIVMLLGIFFTVIYVRTNNIFFTIGIHSLINQPTPLFASTIDSSLLLFVITIGILFLYPRKRNHMFSPDKHSSAI